MEILYCSCCSILKQYEHNSTIFNSYQSFRVKSWNGRQKLDSHARILWGAVCTIGWLFACMRQGSRGGRQYHHQPSINLKIKNCNSSRSHYNGILYANILMSTITITIVFLNTILHHPHPASRLLPFTIIPTTWSKCIKWQTWPVGQVVFGCCMMLTCGFAEVSLSQLAACHHTWMLWSTTSSRPMTCLISSQVSWNQRNFCPWLSRLFEVGPWMLDFNGSKAAVSSISAYLGWANGFRFWPMLLSEHRKCTKSYTPRWWNIALVFPECLMTEVLLPASEFDEMRRNRSTASFHLDLLPMSFLFPQIAQVPRTW